jgi:type VI secretion system protein ImpH
MADSIWGTGRRIDEALYRSAYEFAFFQGVRLLLLKEQEGEEKHARKVHQVVRFKVHTSMAFPPSSVVAVEKSRADLPTAMTVAFLGLLGPARTLPDSYTELAIQQRAFGDESFAAFFDVFHHRLLALYYSAWEKHQFAIGQERARGRRDAITEHLLDLIGMGTAGLEGRLAFPDQNLLRYVGLLAQRPRSAECLRALLHDYLDVPIGVKQFCGRWHRLERDELTMLGSYERCCQLGEGAVAGDMVWNLQSLIRVVLGPLGADEFFEFLPNGRRFREVTELIRWYLGPAIDFELQPLLETGVEPKWGALGRVFWSDGERAARLGWSSWLTAAPFAETADDAVFIESELVVAEA